MTLSGMNRAGKVARLRASLDGKMLYRVSVYCDDEFFVVADDEHDAEEEARTSAQDMLGAAILITANEVLSADTRFDRADRPCGSDGKLTVGDILARAGL